MFILFFFFNDTATTEIYTLSLHDALPISGLTVAENLKIAGWLFQRDKAYLDQATEEVLAFFPILRTRWDQPAGNLSGRSEEHTSELQSRQYLVCRLLLEKKKTIETLVRHF